MDYEKAYKEAIERMKLQVRTGAKISPEYIFPELKESEDEKKLSELMELFKRWEICPEYTEEVNTWIKGLIEKQGEQKHIPWYDLKKAKEAGYTVIKTEEFESIQKPVGWSEEEEKIINGLIRGLTAKKEVYCQTTFSSDAIDITEAINFLNSLRPQSHWKPSEEQMELLQQVHHYLWNDKYCKAEMQDGLGDFIDELEQLKAL